MFGAFGFEHIYFVNDKVDLRAGSDKLAMVVEGELGLNPRENAIFFFRGSNPDRYKALYWDDTGFALHSMKHETVNMKWPVGEGKITEVTVEEYTQRMTDLVPRRRRRHDK